MNDIKRKYISYYYDGGGEIIKRKRESIKREKGIKNTKYELFKHTKRDIEKLKKKG